MNSGFRAGRLRETVSKLTLNTLFGRCLIVTTALNLNGVVTMTFGVGQAVSLVILIVSIFLIFMAGRVALSALMLLFIAAIGSYILFGAVFTQTQDSMRTVLDFVFTYSGTVIIVLAASAYLIESGRNGFWFRELNFVRDVFVLSAVAVWASPLLYTLYVEAPLSIHYRMSGFFANPNEAAYAAAAGLALFMNQPYRSRVINVVVLFLCVGAIILTFSKTGALICLVLLALGALRWIRGTFRVLLVATAAVAMLLLQDVSQLVLFLLDQDFVELNIDQQRRVIEFGALLSGELTASSTTGRSVLVQHALSEIVNRQPFGGGLGSMHHIEGGIRQNDVWLGVHNTFLMVFGESGFVPGIMVVLVFFFIAWRILASGSLGWELSVLVVIAAAFMANHDGLALRFLNIMLAMIIASCAISQRRGPEQSFSQRRIVPLNRNSVWLSGMQIRGFNGRNRQI